MEKKVKKYILMTIIQNTVSVKLTFPIIKLFNCLLKIKNFKIKN